MVNKIHKPLQLLVCNSVDDFIADNGHNVVGAVDLKTLNGGCTCTDICGIIFNVFWPKCGHCLFSDNDSIIKPSVCFGIRLTATFDTSYRRIESAALSIFLDVNFPTLYFASQIAVFTLLDIKKTPFKVN